MAKETKKSTAKKKEPAKKKETKLTSKKLKQMMQESQAAKQAFGQEEGVLLTKEGLEALKKELTHLKDVKRKEVADRIKEAIGYGDLSENAEYEDSKNEQAFVEGRIVELEQKIKNAKIIKGSSKKAGAEVEIGSKVVINNLKTKQDETYVIVGSTETDPLNGRISNESPVGGAVLGKKAGDEVSVNVPEGEVKYKVKKIS